MSGEVTRELSHFCSLLGSDKIKDRKVAATGFLEQLDSARVVNAIDENSYERRKDSLTWNTIFQYVAKFVISETECLHQNQSFTYQWEKRKQDAVKCLRVFLKKADERGPRLKVQDVVGHVIKMVKEPNYNLYIGADYCKFLKNILLVPSYRCDIQAKTWRDLIDMFVTFVVDKPEWLQNSQALLTNIIYLAIDGAAALYTVRGNKLLHFFGNIFKEIWTGSYLLRVDYLLAALNSFVRSCAEDCRGQVCRLGENLFPLLLQMWKTPTMSPSFKDQLIQFMRFQVCTHHPFGAHRDEEGSWCSSVTHWKKCLQKLYEAILIDIGQLGNRVQRASSTKLDSGLPAPFFELAADVFHQVFWTQTSYYSSSTNQDTSEPGTKRQRMEQGWDSTRDKLENSSENLFLLAWLQILSTIFAKHPSSIPSAEFLPFFTTLHQLLTKHKRHETITAVLRCIEDLVACCSRRRDQLNSLEADSFHSVLKQIWASALRVIGLKHLTDPAFCLLTTLLKEQVVEPDQEIWRVICGSGVPSRSSVEFIATYLRLYSLPENFQPVSSVDVFAPQKGPFTLRHYLFDWLMPVDDECEATGGISTSIWVCKNPNRFPSLPVLASVLVSLTQKFTTAFEVSGIKESVCQFQDETFQDAERCLVQMQEVYLKSSFDEKDSPWVNDGERKDSLSSGPKHNKKVETLSDLLLERLAKTAWHLCESIKFESTGLMSKERLMLFGGRLEGLIRFCSLVCQVVVFLLKNNSLSQEKVTSLPAIRKLGNILRKVANGVNEISVTHELDLSVRVEVILGVLTELESLFTMLPAKANSPEQLVKDLLREKTPSSLLDDALTIFTGKWGQCMSVNSSRLDEVERSFLNQSTSVTLGDETDGFDEFESEVSSSEDNVTQSGTHSQATKKNARTESLRTCCARFLCSWSMQDGEAAVLCNGDPQPEEIQGKVIEFLRSEDFNVSKEEDLKLYFTVTSVLASSKAALPSQHLEALMSVFREAMSVHRRDQKICHQGLKLLMTLTPHLSNRTDESYSDTNLETSRQIAAHVLKAFWSLKDTQYCPAVRLQMAQCMEAFLKVDPEEKWSNMKQIKKDSAGVVKESASLALSEHFPKLLSDSSHSVRMYMASAISVLFVRYISDDAAVPASRDSQYNSFEQVSNILVQSLSDAVGPSLSEEEREDEGVSRSSSMLACLKHIALFSPICEKRVMALLFQAVKEQFVDKELVMKVLSQLAVELGYSSRASYVESHLKFVLDNWLNHGYKITDFPCQLLDFRTIPDFFQTHHPSILANLISRPDTVQQSIELFAKQVNPRSDCSEYLAQSFCSIEAFLLPWYAVQRRTDVADTSSGGQRVKIEQARRSHEFLVNVLTNEAVDKIMTKKFDEQVVELLLRMYEPPSEGSDIAKFTKETDPEPDPPYFTSHAIKATLDYLATCFPEGKTLVSVLCTNKDTIQKILLALISNMATTHLVHEKRRILSMYRLFVLLLLKELRAGLGNTWAFFIRDVIHSLLRIITDDKKTKQRPRQPKLHLVLDDDLFLPCCNLLYYVCKSAVECCSQEFGSHLHAIVSVLTPYAMGQDEKAEQALQLLDFLIVDESEVLSEAIRLLDPFPDTAEFKTINKRYTEIREERTSLNQEITHFLSADSGSSPLSRLEGLRHLRQTIIKNKEQLEGILNRTEVDRSAPVADLVHHLIGLGSVLSGCQGDRAKPVQCEVANCLGDIGAVDLSTVALGCTRKSDVFGLLSTKYAADPVSQRNSIIVSLLNGYLIDKNVEVVAASSSCLKKILATASGLDLLRKYGECKQEQLLWYLEPFRHSKKKRSLGHTEAMECDVREDSSDARVRDASLWIPGTDGKEYSHGQWITKLACTLIDSGCVNDEILGILSPICRTKVEFAERVFPYLVHNMLESGDDQSKTVLSEHFRGFFSHCKGSSVIQSRAGSPLPSVIQSTTSSGDTCGVKKESIRTMLAVVTYLRTQNVPKRGRVQSTLWDNNFWLDLDYLEVATAAQKCSAYFTALLYTEIWTDIQKSDPVSFNAITLPSNSQHAAMEVGTSQGSDGSLSTSYQALLLEAYSCIGEPDSVYGAGAGRLADIESRIRTYAHEQTWDKALGACDLQMQSSSTVSQTDLLQSLKNFGLDHVMRVYLKGLAAENMQATAEVSELQYESAWRNCVWDLDSSSSVGSEIPLGFHQCLYSCLCALQDEEGELFQATLDSARLKVLAEVSHVSLESVRSVYPSLSRLQCIVELENFAIRLNSPEDSLIDVWNERFPLPDNDFEFLEPVLALRTSMLQTLVKVKRDKSVGPEGVLHVAHACKDLVTHLEMQAKIARQSHNPQVAEKALFTIRQLQNAITEIQNQLEGEDLGVTWSWKMEEAKLRWARGEQDTAMYLLKTLTRHLDKARDHSTEAIGLYPQALGLYGTWLAESKSENPNTIIEDFLEKAACLMECMEGGNQASRIEAFLSLAWFADSQYQKKVDFMSSSAYENKETLMKNAKVESERLQKVCEPEKDRYTRTLNLQAQMDERELLQVVEDKRKFLQTAVEYYIKTLQAGDKYDLRMFRLCSLWFDNAREDFVSEMIKDALTKIQSRKFLPLMYQLAARLGTKSHDNRMFQGTLNEMIERTAIDHPHHTMFILLALANAEKDSKYLTKKSASSRLSRTTSKGSKGFAGEARIQTACKLIESIGNQRGKLVKDMEQLCEAYIELAYVNVTHLKNERGPFNIPDNLMITKISNLREVPVPTLDVKVDPLCRYDDIVHVVKFDSSFSLAGGVNLPKIIYCVGSDGIKRRQLVKGRDDLRQDAVMEQVFGMVNQLLMKNSETRKRKLKMRTYKVIPLSQRSGIVEWCENTVPLGEYLIGRPGSKTGAHQRYYPRDLSPFDCRKKMTGEKGTSRYEVYQEVVEHFHPVFRHFFLERFPDPAVWFERRLSYTRGVATSSIVGYVVGLGDRHVQNILVDCNTAELVHIDLGVAFEQGKFLPTPETVPFRLTRDLVDGMGLTGVEGVFRRCCEKTMDVMRTSQESLMTIVEVLLYDPLSSWTLSPEKRKALQQQAEVDINDITTCAATGDVVDSALVAETNAFEDNANKMAKRVLLRLKQKLDGVEDGVHLSVQGQVKHLVREAMDPKNLCRLFPGWQAWV